MELATAIHSWLANIAPLAAVPFAVAIGVAVVVAARQLRLGAVQS